MDGNTKSSIFGLCSCVYRVVKKRLKQIVRETVTPNMIAAVDSGLTASVGTFVRGQTVRIGSTKFSLNVTVNR